MTDQMNEIVGHSDNIINQASIARSNCLAEKYTTNRKNFFAKELQSLENIAVTEK